MFRNLIKVALRTLMKNKAFSLINIMGLAISMSVCLLIIMIIKDQMSFDNFHEKGERIYRINTDVFRSGGRSELYASTTLAIAQELSNNYTLADEVVRLRRGFFGDMEANKVTIPVSGMYTDQSFFNVFDIDFIYGVKSDALNKPYSVVLTSETAKKFFRDSNPVGLSFKHRDTEYTITGVLDEFKGKSHLEFEALASMSTLEARESEISPNASINNWTNVYGRYVYILLKKDRTIEELEAIYPVFEKKMFDANQSKALIVRDEDDSYKLETMALGSINPGPILSNNLGSGMPLVAIYFLSGLALIIMISAGFNYTSLSVARSLTRAKEVGVRKVSGAQRHQIFVQFLTESVIYSLAALFFAYGIMRFLWPFFSQLDLNRFLALEYSEDISLFLIFGGFSILIGLLAGVFPAWYLSSFQPISILKDGGGVKLTRMILRKVLIVCQFVISLLLIVSAKMVNEQNQYTMNADYGIDRMDILNISLQGNDYKLLAEELGSHSDVIRVGGLSHALGTWADRSEDVRLEPTDEKLNIRDFSLDNNYLENLKVKFLAGNRFPGEISGENELFVIVNEKAVDFLQLGTPDEAIGKSLILGDSTNVQIIGVIENFNFRPLTYTIGPLIMRYRPQDYSIISLKLGNDPLNFISYAEQVWKKHDEIHAFDYILFDDQIREAYTGFDDIVKVTGFASFLAVFIAALGLLGMVIYTVETRVKEVGIRKVLGAKESDIAFILSKGFFKLLVIAVVIATPLAYLVNNMWLENIPYHVNVSISSISFGIIIMAGLGFLAVASQTYQAARANPVEALKDE